MEENYQNIIYSVLRLLGVEIHNEVHLNNGRINMVIVNRGHIYIFEFKMDKPAEVVIASEISRMTGEHEFAGGTMDKINNITSGYAVPQDGCNTYQVAFNPT